MFFEQSYYVLRTFLRTSLPPVEFTMFFEHFTGFISLRSKVWCSAELTIGFDSRYFVPLMHLPMAAASKHCLWQGMGKGLFQEWSFCENNSMKNNSVEKLFWWILLQITLYFCRARIFVSKHYPLLRTRSLIDLWDDVPAEGDVLLLRFEFCLVGGALLGISEDGCRLRLGCF